MFAANFKYIIVMNVYRLIRLLFQILLLILIPANVFADGNQRLFQLGLFPPISSNGVNSGEITNIISLNLIGGYSAGNKAFELGCVWNASRDYTRGLQIAGLINYSGNSDNSIQISGLGNIAVFGKSPLQIGGLFNVADRVNGVQVSGLVNVARNVKGVQIGLINYMENGDEGVSIGLINIARHEGKYEFEISFSEAVNTLFSFRLGTDRFYTIFSGGVNYFSNPLEYAIGLGFGTSIGWRKYWSNQVEIQAFGVSYEKKFLSNSLNSIIQIRIPVCREFGKHFKVFAGPTLNFGLQNVDVADNVKLSLWPMWFLYRNNLQVSVWIGISAGIRF